MDHGEQLLDQFPCLIDHTPAPSLIHGDLWGNNILIDDANPSRPQIRAYIDARPMFADVAYELAYLYLFKTADATFFDLYQRDNPVNRAFDRRRQVYWLIMLLGHSQQLGGAEIAACEQAAMNLRAIA